MFWGLIKCFIAIVLYLLLKHKLMKVQKMYVYLFSAYGIKFNPPSIAKIY